LGDADAVIALTPSPSPAVNEKVHVDFGVAEVWWPVWLPVRSTHLASEEVFSVNVRAPPFLA
jgi:hypothetical protein